MPRPKNRPTTITEWEKQKTIIPTHDELHVFREEEKKKYNTELKRQSNHKDITMTDLYTDYNIEPGILQSDKAYEDQIEIINATIVAGDEPAMLRLQEIQEAYKIYKQKITQFLKARDNIKKNYLKIMARIDTLDKRRQNKLTIRREKREALARATVESVEELRLEVNKIKSLRQELKQNINYERKITWLTAKVEEHEQELFKIKNIISSKGLDQ